MHRSHEPNDETRAHTGTRGVLLRAGWLMVFLGAVALVVPFFLPTWSAYGVDPPPVQQVFQYPNAQMAPQVCGWGLIVALPLVVAGSQVFRRTPHEFAMPIAAVGAFIGLMFFVPMASNVISQLTAVHELPIRDSTGWLMFVGSFLIVVGDLIVLAVSWIISWSDSLA